MIFKGKGKFYSLSEERKWYALSFYSTYFTVFLMKNIIWNFQGICILSALQIYLHFNVYRDSGYIIAGGLTTWNCLSWKQVLKLTANPKQMMGSFPGYSDSGVCGSTLEFVFLASSSGDQ